MPKKENLIKICPKCGSTNISTEFSNPANVAYGNALNYVCNNCNYITKVFPEVKSKDVGKFRKNLNI